MITHVCVCERVGVCECMRACAYVCEYVGMSLSLCICACLRTYVRACSGTHYVSFMCACEHFTSPNTSACMRQIYNEVNLRPHSDDWRSMAISVN